MTLEKELFDAVIAQIPVLKYFKQSMWQALDKGDDNKFSRIKAELDDYCKTLMTSPVRLDKAGSGATISAAYDLKKIFTKVYTAPAI
ncbi:MAG: hypothetical protein KTR20_01950 [Cellvibrionaceae bacterium]|nr:hypothetical protein [Cellvibrionaceae bacterium]